MAVWVKAASDSRRDTRLTVRRRLPLLCQGRNTSTDNCGGCWGRCRRTFDSTNRRPLVDWCNEQTMNRVPSPISREKPRSRSRGSHCPYKGRNDWPLRRSTRASPRHGCPGGVVSRNRRGWSKAQAGGLREARRGGGGLVDSSIVFWGVSRKLEVQKFISAARGRSGAGPELRRSSPLPGGRTRTR